MSLLFGCHEFAEAAREIWHVHNLTRLRSAVIRKEEGRRYGPEPQHRLIRPDEERENFRERETIGAFESGLYNLREAHGSVAFEREHQAIENARNSRGQNSLRGDGRQFARLFPLFRFAGVIESDRRFRGRGSHSADDDRGLACHLDDDRHFAA